MNRIEFENGYIEASISENDKILITIGAYQMGGKENIVNSADLDFNQFQQLIMPILNIFKQNNENIESVPSE